MDGSQYRSGVMATLHLHRSEDWLPRVALLATLVLLAGILGFWSMKFLAPAPLPSPVIPLPDSASSTGSPSRTLFFGAGTGPIVLKGVVVGPPEESVAVLSINGAPGRAYRIGKDIAAGVKLVAVTDRSVTLERNGVRETLPLALRSSAKIAPPSPR